MPPSTPSTLKLVFTTTSLCNVTIATESDDYYYEIVTPKWDPLNTQIRRLDSDTGTMTPVAEMSKENESSRYTRLRFINPDGAETEFITPEEFLTVDNNGNRSATSLHGNEENGNSLSSLGTFVGTDSKRYRWQKSKQSVEVSCFALKYRHMKVLTARALSSY